MRKFINPNPDLVDNTDFKNIPWPFFRYTKAYTPVEEKAHENRTWIDKMYFRPFSRDEINRNAKLVQNPGYGK